MIAPAAPQRPAALLGLLGLVALALSLVAIIAALALPASAEERLNATAACGGVTVTGAGFGDRSVLLLATDLRTGRALAGPVATSTTPGGSFRTWLPMDLSSVQTVVVSAWRHSGATVTLTAKDLVQQPCPGSGTATPGMLPMTGGPHPGLLALGVGLLTLGVGLLRCAGSPGSPGCAPGTAGGRRAAAPWRRALAGAGSDRHAGTAPARG